MSGNAHLLDAIGATFIGTARRSRRPSARFSVWSSSLVKNGLLIIGWNFYWQHVGIGVLVFLVLAVSFGLRRKRS
jgi:ribose transport system permease protein